jgi:hypothetical protein
VDRFSETRDFLGMVSFASSANLDYPIASNFKSSSPSLPTVINSITCVGATSSAMALWNAYSELAKLALPGALNIIVFFTDGNPTALTSDFPIKASSPCTSKAAKLGVLTLTFSGGSVPVSPYGLLNLTNAPFSSSGETSAMTSDGTCKFVTSGPTSVATDIQYVPNLDHYGNSTNTGYKPVTGDGAGHVATDATSIMNASINAADNTASRIRNGALVPGVGSLSNVVIFSIGLGNAALPPDADFLERVANDPRSPIHDSTKRDGLYVFAQTSSDLDDAFQRVASEILRLAK